MIIKRRTLKNLQKNNYYKKENEPETVYKSKSKREIVDAFDHLIIHVKQRLEFALQESGKHLGKHMLKLWKKLKKVNFSIKDLP